MVSANNSRAARAGHQKRKPGPKVTEAMEAIRTALELRVEARQRRAGLPRQNDPQDKEMVVAQAQLDISRAIGEAMDSGGTQHERAQRTLKAILAFPASTLRLVANEVRYEDDPVSVVFRWMARELSEDVDSFAFIGSLQGCVKQNIKQISTRAESALRASKPKRDRLSGFWEAA